MKNFLISLKKQSTSGFLIAIFLCAFLFFYYFLYWFFIDFANYSFLRALKNSVIFSFLPIILIYFAVNLKRCCKSFWVQKLAEIFFFIAIFGACVIFLIGGLGSYGTGAYETCMSKCLDDNKLNVDICEFDICDFTI